MTNMETVICNLDRRFFILALLVFLNVVVSDGAECKKEGCGCVFTDEKGDEKIISLSDINKDGEP